MAVSRREFLRRAAMGGALFAPSLAGLATFNDAMAGTLARAAIGKGGFGELYPAEGAPEIYIPIDFRCVRLSRTLSPSLANPDLTVPQAFDGMAAFPLPNGNVRLIRNHEINDPVAYATPFGKRAYDGKCGGGTMSLEVEIRGSWNDREVRLLREFPTLSGTHVNCAGGPTPWGSWLSCEETVEGPTLITWPDGRVSGGRERAHGYVFEVPATAEEEVEPVPLKAMGRFVHEAVAVDPATGFIYETEDLLYDPKDPQLQPGSGFYRFIPNRPGELQRGGKLQMLAVTGSPNLMTMYGQTPGKVMPAEWVDIDDPDPEQNTGHDRSAVFRQGFAKSGAVFQRLEGCWYGDGSIFFDATSGGDARAGQVWQYRPTSRDAGQLILVFESPSRDVLDSPDNICMSPRGGLVICEDGVNDQFIRALSASGDLFNLVHQPKSTLTSEFCGACFSPDGSVLFFNIQGSTSSRSTRLGATYAMWGPWERGGL